MRLGALVAVAAALGCGKPSADATPSAGSGSVVAATGSPAASSGGPSASSATPTTGGSASAAAGSAGVASSSWTGTYKSTASAVSVPPEWKKVHWSDTQSTLGVGDGTLTLVVDGTGRVSGSVEGPLGPAVLDGAAADGKLSATLRRKDPADQGFTGTLLATMTGDRVEGTINASPGGGGTVRTATFVLARAAAR